MLLVITKWFSQFLSSTGRGRAMPVDNADFDISPASRKQRAAQAANWASILLYITKCTLTVFIPVSITRGIYLDAFPSNYRTRQEPPRLVSIRLDTQSPSFFPGELMIEDCISCVKRNDRENLFYLTTYRRVSTTSCHVPQSETAAGSTLTRSR